MPPALRRIVALLLPPLGSEELLEVTLVEAQGFVTVLERALLLKHARLTVTLADDSDVLTWDPWCLDTAAEQSDPINVPEKLLLLDILEAWPVVDVSDEDILEEVADDLRHIPVKVGQASRDILVDLLRRRRLEGRLPRDELADQDAERPDVDSAVIRLPEQDLWSDIHCRSAVGVCFAARALEHLGEAEVDQLQVTTALHRKHHILRLDVAVDYLLLV